MRIAQPNEPCTMSQIITAAMLTLTAKRKYRCYNSKILSIHESCRGNTTGDENGHDLHDGSFNAVQQHVFIGNSAAADGIKPLEVTSCIATKLLSGKQIYLIQKEFH